MTAAHVVVPLGIDDPSRPSGGNAYDRQICQGLAALGWLVHEHAVGGAWPRPDASACAALARRIAEIPDGAVMLIDGLIASAVPHVLVPEARRLRLVVLVHMPARDAGAAERSVLSAAAAVVTTSEWARGWLVEGYGLPAATFHVARPGVDPAALASGTASGGELLCVAAVTPGKGHDVLIEALASVADLHWRCVCVGSKACDPAFVTRLGRQVQERGIGGRVHFVGSRVGADLDTAYAAADVLVLASQAETYGMVVTEALARGLPVVATAVGGLPEAFGPGVPGLLVQPGNPSAFAEALRCWLSDTDLRQRLRHAARGSRETLSSWSTTSSQISRVLAEVTA